MTAEGRQSSENKSVDSGGASIEQTSGSVGPPRALQWIEKFRELVGEDLVSVFGGRNWTTTGAVLFTLGVVSDLASITGPISKYGLFICGLAVLVLGTIVFFRFKAHPKCVGPLFSALMLGVTFSIVLGLQNLANATGRGVIVEKFPQASKIQQVMFGKLEEILDNQGRIEDKLNQVIAEFERDSPNADPGTVEAFRKAVEGLAASGDSRKRKALSDFAGGRKDRAIVDLMRLAEDQSSAAQDTVEQAAATWKEVGALALRTDTSQAISAYEKAVELQPNNTGARRMLAYALSREGDLAGAKTQYEALLTYYDPTDNRLLIAYALGALSSIEVRLGYLDAAEQYLNRSLEIHQEFGNEVSIAWSIGILGSIAWARGDLDIAAEYLERSVKLFEELENKKRIAPTLGSLGALELDRNRLDSAEGYIRRSGVLYTELGNNHGVASALENLGVLEARRGNRFNACSLWTEAEKVFASMNAELQQEQVRNRLRTLCPDTKGSL